MMLLFGAASQGLFKGLIIFSGLLCYAALEWMVAEKKHYQSGVDDGLMWSSGVLVVAGMSFDSDLSAQLNALIVFVVALWFTIRFTDRLMALVSMLALLAVVFLISSKMGNIARAILPFLLMLLTASFYFIATKLGAQQRYRYYHSALVVIETAALVCFYLAGNYYVVREAGNEFLGLGLAESESIPFGWIFWIFTVAIPPLYIFAGIKRKDIVLIRTGVLLIAMMVFTIRNYYHVLPVETAMLLGGLILTGVSYLFTKMLKETRGGFSSLPAAYSNKSALQNIEAIIIADTLSTQQSAEDGTKFGGGSFGGGGASGDY